MITFIDYVIVWRDQLVINCRRNYERKVDIWNEMKSIMSRRFVHNHYYKELYQRL